MSEDTKIIESKPITLDFIKQIANNYDKKFENIRIYGTPENPLFIANDIQDLLDLKDLNVTKKYEQDLERVEVPIKTKKGIRNAVALTEQGLYRALFTSKTEIAKSFRKFVTIVLRELRLHKVVTLEDALEKLKNQNVAYQLQIDEEHKKANKYKQESINFFDKYTTNQYKLVNMQEKIDKYEAKNGENFHLHYLEERYMKKLYINMIEPPPSAKYLIDENYDIDEDPTDDDNYVFALEIEPKAGYAPHVYVHSTKKVDKDKIHKYFVLKEFGIKKSQKDTDDPEDVDRYHKNKYFSSINQIRSAIEDFILQQEYDNLNVKIG